MVDEVKCSHYDFVVIKTETKRPRPSEFSDLPTQPPYFKVANELKIPVNDLERMYNRLEASELAPILGELDLDTLWRLIGDAHGAEMQSRDAMASCEEQARTVAMRQRAWEEAAADVERRTRLLEELVARVTDAEKSGTQLQSEATAACEVASHKRLEAMRQLNAVLASLTDRIKATRLRLQNEMSLLDELLGDDQVAGGPVPH